MSLSPCSLSAESILPSTIHPNLTPPAHTAITMNSNHVPSNYQFDEVPSSIQPVVEATLSDVEIHSQPTQQQQLFQTQGQSSTQKRKGNSRHHRTQPSSSAGNGENQSAISGHASTSEQKRNHHNKHTRKCRARLNHRYDSLHGMLPQRQGTEIRHKVQILDHTIQALCELRETNKYLEMLNAGKSKPTIISWVQSFVPNSESFMSALDPLVKLVSKFGCWPYAEVWQVTNMPSTIRLESHMINDTQLLQPSLKLLGEHTQHSCTDLQIKDEFVGSVFETRQTVWSNRCVEKCLHPTRAQLMTEACIRTGFAVPVPVSGVLSHVIAFFDVQPRVRDVAHEDFATFAAVCVGNSYGASRDETEIEIETEAEEIEDIEEDYDEEDEDGTNTA